MTKSATLAAISNADCAVGDLESRPEYFRKVDFVRRAGRLDHVLRPDGYSGHLLHQGNRSVVIATHVPPKLFGVPEHRHHVDQIFLCVEGQVTIGIEGVDYRVDAGGLIVVPRGTPHTSRNDAGVPALYLEILAPAPIFFSGLLVKEGVDVIRDADRRPFVVQPQELKEMLPDDDAAGPHLLMQKLLDPEMGYPNATVYHARSLRRNVPPELHVHRFDQFLFVAEGELTVRILFEKYRVPKGTLVVIPGGTPHTQFNDSDAPERHFTILTPPFRKGPGEEWPDQPVSLQRLGR